MKKTLLIGFILLTHIATNACDICGCGVGGTYIGILPEFHKHVFGMRYRSNSLLSHIGVGGSTTYLTTTEKYRTAELWAGWNLGKKFRILLNLPYSFNERTNQGLRKSKNGPGDITVSGFYQFLNKTRSIAGNRLLVQSLWIGAGIKLPSGKYTAADKQSAVQSANLFQLGTGSTDFLVQSMYDLRLQDAGFNASASYKMNTANRYQYNYGNKLNFTAQVYYKWRVKNQFTVAPNSGILFESSKKDIDQKMIADISGGKILFYSAGLEASENKLAIGMNWQTPLSQKMANGIVVTNNRLMVHLSVLL